MKIRMPTQLGSDVTVGFCFTGASKCVNFSQNDGDMLDRFELPRDSILTFDCAERFNQISVDVRYENDEPVGVRIVSLRRGIGQYAIELGVNDCYAEVLYDKITPKTENNSAWRKRVAQ